MDQFDETLNKDGDVPVKRGRGRPKGVKNKVRQPMAILQSGVMGDREKAPEQKPFDIFQTDPLSMVQRFYRELDFRLTALSNMRKMAKPESKEARGLKANPEEIVLLTDVSNVLLKSLQAHDKALALAEKLGKNKTPAQLLEIAIQKVEGQDIATLRGIIKRLRDRVTQMAPVTRQDKIQMGEVSPHFVSAGDALKALGEDDA